MGRNTDAEVAASSSAWTEFRVTQVPVSLTLALRQAVLGLQGGQQPLHLPGDDDPTTVAFAAVDTQGEVLSVARVSAEEPPLPIYDTVPAETPSRRIRGMATRPDVRNCGIGSAVLGATIAFVASNGGGLLWCNARVPAVGLYRRAGFTQLGGEFEEPLRGPHVLMWRRVGPAGTEAG